MLLMIPQARIGNTFGLIDLHLPHPTNWKTAVITAVPITTLILALFYHWFAIADRYIIFLYGHTTTNIPSAQPFDSITSSRYWMAGLVASGAALLLYTSLNWLAGRWQNNFAPPVWWQVWAACAVPLMVGIPFITMTFNSPTLPFSLAVTCLISTWAGLAFALWPGAWAAQHPWQLLWLAGDGLGLVPVLLGFRAVELPGQGLSITPSLAWAGGISTVLMGAVWLVGMQLLRRWRQQPHPGPVPVTAIGLAISYLFFPLLHHLIGTPPAYRYITNAANFFALNPLVQITAVFLAVGLAIFSRKLQSFWQNGAL